MQRAFGGVSDEQAYLDEIAPLAYEFCVRRFGTPLDAERPFEIHRDFSHSLCSYNGLLGYCAIEISKTQRMREELCSTMGHEMYHRVTMIRNGLHRELWLNEAMAFLASLWFLREQGFDSTADYFVRYTLYHTRQLNISKLKSTRKSKNPVRLYSGRAYPPDFGNQVRRLAIELQWAVGPENAARIVGAESLDDWMALLTDDQRARVKALLEVR